MLGAGIMTYNDQVHNIISNSKGVRMRVQYLVGEEGSRVLSRYD